MQGISEFTQRRIHNNLPLLSAAPSFQQSVRLPAFGQTLHKNYIWQTDQTQFLSWFFLYFHHSIAWSSQIRAFGFSDRTGTHLKETLHGIGNGIHSQGTSHTRGEHCHKLYHFEIVDDRKSARGHPSSSDQSLFRFPPSNHQRTCR